MISALHLHMLVEHCDGTLVGDSCEFNRVSIDSRSIEPGDLFVALVGDNFDGHDFIKTAIAAGACGIVAQKYIESSDVPFCIVDDSTKALGDIASLQRQQYKGELVAITGSSGKTTVKGMLGAILSAHVGSDHCFATKGNFNNHIGVPLSLLALTDEHQYAAIEMGASAVGEIDYLTHIAQPHVAVITNAMAVHIEGFGSLDRIASAKGEIYNGLGNEGIAVINGDDAYADQWLAQNQQRHQRVAIYARAPRSGVICWSGNEAKDSRHCFGFDLSVTGQSIFVQLNVLGEHNIINALAAATCADALGVSLQAIKQGLEYFVGEPGRLNVLAGCNGAIVIDDSYNASPGSVKAAIDVLKQFSATTVLVLGDMGELGEAAALLHQDVGDYAIKQHIDCMLTKGVLSEAAQHAFTSGGGVGGKHFDSFESLIDAATAMADSKTIFLIKGSHSSMMDKVVQAMTVDGEHT